MCDNVFALARNPFTIFTATELHVDPNYDSYSVLPWWVKTSIWFKKAMQDLIDWFNNLAVVKWYKGLSYGNKKLVGTILLTVATVIAWATGGLPAAIALLVEVAIGVGVGIGIWAISTIASGKKLTLDGFFTAALDSFVISSLFACVHAFANAIKTAARSSQFSDEFLQWLNDGEANNTVYKGIDSNDNQIYTGITKQGLETRLHQHLRQGKRFVRLDAICTNLTRNQARSIETYLILTDFQSQINMILSVSRTHRYFKDAMLWAKMFLGG